MTNITHYEALEQMAGTKAPDINLAVVYRDPEKLVPYGNNVRTHSAKQIAKLTESIKAFGFVSPVIINERNVVIAGHARTQAPAD